MKLDDIAFVGADAAIVDPVIERCCQHAGWGGILALFARAWDEWAEHVGRRLSFVLVVLVAPRRNLTLTFQSDAPQSHALLRASQATPA